MNERAREWNMEFLLLIRKWTKCLRATKKALLPSFLFPRSLGLW